MFLSVLTNLPVGNTLFAQVFEETDIMGQMQEAFQNFVESGQVWALLIGLFLGYMFRSFTSF